MGGGVSATLKPLYPRERPVTHCIGGWVGPADVLDGCEKSRCHRDSILGPSSPWRVSIPTELFRLPTYTGVKGKDIPVSMNACGGSRVIAPGCFAPVNARVIYTKITATSQARF
jgi:hypothetical protein